MLSKLESRLSLRHLNLIVAIAAFKVAFGTIVRSVIPFITIMLIWLVIVIVYPTLSLGLLGR